MHQKAFSVMHHGNCAVSICIHKLGSKSDHALRLCILYRTLHTATGIQLKSTHQPEHSNNRNIHAA